MTGDLLARLNDTGVPVFFSSVRPEPTGDSPNAVTDPWFGTSTCSGVPSTGPTTVRRWPRGRGTRWHGYTTSRVRCCPRAQPRRNSAPSMRSRVTAQTAAATTVAPALADRLEAVAVRLTARLSDAGRHGVVHGDFSADQALTDDGVIRLSDLDRVGYGAVVSDLGCSAAVISAAGPPA